MVATQKLFGNVRKIGKRKRASIRGEQERELIWRQKKEQKCLPQRRYVLGVRENKLDKTE